MKARGIVAAAAALIGLAGCERLGIGGGGAVQAGNQAANAAAGDGGKDGGGNQAAGPAAGGKDPAGAVQASATGAGLLDRDYLVGSWTDNGDCGTVTEFTSDGRFIANNGAVGLWNLDGDRLTVTGNATISFRIVPVDQNTITVVNQDDSLGRSTRC